MLYKSIATVGGFTFLSRMTGCIRDVLIADILGVSGVTDAFFVAFKLPNFFRRFFAEGAFNAAFIPLFSKTLLSAGPVVASLYAEKVFALLLFGLSGFVLLFEHFMPTIIFLFAPGFEATPERFQLAVTLSRITFPYILFISLASLLSGMLNSMGKFAAAAGTPIILNLTMIIALFMALFDWVAPGTGLAWAVFLAGVLQLGWLWVSCHYQGMRIRPTFPSLAPEIKPLIRLGIPGAISAGVFQLNLLMDSIFASCLSTGAISYLFYADRLNQLPLGVIGVAVSTTLLPALSKHIKAEEHNEAHSIQNRAIEFALAVTLPASMGLVMLGAPLVGLLFERGNFTPDDVAATGYTLSAFASGLPAYVLVKILQTQFFARQDTTTPMKLAIMTVFLNFGLNCLLIGPFGYVGLALATAFAAWFNAFTLGFCLFVRKWIVFDERLKRILPRLLISSLVMGIFCYGIQQIFPFPKDLVMRISIISIWILGAILFYLAAARVAGAFYFRDFRRLLRGELN